MAPIADPSPASQLAAFISKYSPEMQASAHGILRKMRTRVRGACELVYDNYNTLAIAFAASERVSEAVFSIAVYPRWVSLFFIDGVHLPDPNGILKGSGKTMRHIVLQAATDLDEPAVRALIIAALERAKTPIPANGRRRLIIKSISAKQRPRRPEARHQ